MFDGGSFVVNARRLAGAHDAVLAARRSALTQWTRGDGTFRCDGQSEWCERAAARRHLQRDDARPARLRTRRTASRASSSGLSGGIDSALTAAVAVDALGPERVRGVRLPSRFTSDASMDDAQDSAHAARHAPRHDRRSQPAWTPPKRRWRRVRRPRARRHRGEPAGAHPRRAADGAVEQVRRAAGDDRQQVGDVGRLRHALRRHVRRLLGAEGRLQDRGLRAVDMAQRAARRPARSAQAAASFRSRPSPRRRPRSCGRTRRTRTRCRRTTSSTPSCNGLVEDELQRGGDRGARLRARRR